MLEPLLDRFRKHDRNALARLLSMAARGEIGSEALAQIPAAAKPARVVAITGSGGVGKSTLIGKLIEHLRALKEKVAVLACDPQSPLSGGALLGDRFRMPSRPDDDGVFIRSLATPGGQGAVAEHLDLMIRLLEAFGFGVVLIETVGAGQGDTAVRPLADVVVLLLQPETGDDLQWEKAGLLEVADIVVIHKADLPGADAAEAQVKASLALSHGPAVPVLRVSSKSGDAVAALWEATRTLPLRRPRFNPEARGLLDLLRDAVASRFCKLEQSANGPFQEIVREWRGGSLTPEQAADKLLQLISPERSEHGDVEADR
jgi:LAO/AO transport system kinase